jgi:hypothetical protein
VSLRTFLVAMTAIAVVSDSLLHPFYPQYFESVFGVTDPMHVAFYIAACSLTVLATFPAWARVAARVSVLRLLIATQAATLVLNLACASTTSLAVFWVLSLAGMVFKASYLLIYPYVLSLESRAQHIHTIGLLALVVHFGNIMASLLSGALFELTNGHALFVAMAAGDLLQIGLCVWLWRSRTAQAAPAPEAPTALPEPSRHAMAKLGATMLLLYFGAYLIEPFFSVHWERVSGTDNKLAAGVVFALPGLAALLGLWRNARAEPSGDGGLATGLALAVVGVGLQLVEVPAVLLAGRFLYGWALFQAMVRLDSMLFQMSTPDRYAIDFSKINLWQGLGVFAASLVAGRIVLSANVSLPFWASMACFAVGIALSLFWLRKDFAAPLAASEPSS